MTNPHHLFTKRAPKNLWSIMSWNCHIDVYDGNLVGWWEVIYPPSRWGTSISYCIYIYIHIIFSAFLQEKKKKIKGEIKFGKKYPLGTRVRTAETSLRRDFAWTRLSVYARDPVRADTMQLVTFSFLEEHVN